MSLMSSATVPDRCETVDVHQLHLHLAIAPLTTGALQGNGGLRREVPEQGNLVVGKRLHLFAAQSNYPDYLIVFEQRNKQARSKTCVHHRFSKNHPEDRLQLLRSRGCGWVTGLWQFGSDGSGFLRAVDEDGRLDVLIDE